MGSTGPGWISRHPIAFTFVLLTGLFFGFCGFAGVVGAIVSLEADDSSAADRRNDADEVVDDEGDGEPQEVAATTQAPEPTSEPEPEAPPTYVVVRVVDGDTVELGNGETVRLVGIDAPENGECGFDRATEKLMRLVEGQRVTLGESDEDRDRYDRLLRYVDRGSVDAGLALIESGLAIARYDSRDGYGEHPRESRYIKADQSSPDVACAPPAPPPPPKPTKPPKQFVAPPSSCEPGYSPCVPQYPPDLDCADTGPVTVTGSDPHGLDGDGDGVACGGD